MKTNLRVLVATLFAFVAGCGETEVTPGPSMVLEPVVRRDFEKATLLSGVLEASPDAVIYAPEAGRLVMLAEQGAVTKVGDIVARIDATALREQIRTKKVELSQLQKERKIEELTLSMKRFELDNRIEFAKLDLETLQIVLKLTDEGVDAVEATRVELEERNSQRKIEYLAQAIIDQTPLAEKGVLSKLDLEDLKTQLEEEKFNLRSLQIQFKLLLMGGKEKDVLTAKKDVDLSKSAFDLLLLKKKGFEELERDSLAEIDARIEALQSEIGDLEKRLESTEIRAPLAGVAVHEGSDAPGRNNDVQAGQSVSFGQSLVRIIARDKFHINTSVWEVDLLGLEEGQDVRFHLGGREDRQYRGKVERISRVATGASFRRWLHPDRQVVKAQIACLDVDPAFMPGMGVTLRVIRDRREKVLAIDTAALVDGNVKMADGSLHPVRTGFWQDTHVEITHGLSEGDQVQVPRVVKDTRTWSVVALELRDLRVRVEASGEIKSRQVVPVDLADLDDQATLVELKTEGDTVAAGDVIARLEMKEMQSKIDEKRLDLEVKKKSLEMSRKQASKEVFTAENNVRLEELNLKIAELEEQLLLEGKTDKEKKELELELGKVNQDLQSVQRLLDVKKEFSGRGFASQKEVKELEQQRDASEVLYAVAEVKQELARIGGTQLERRKALVTRLKAALSVELKRQDLASTRQKVVLRQEKSELEVEAAQDVIKQKEKMVASLTAKAPRAGVVMLPEHWTNTGERKYAIGDQVSSHEVFIRIADATDLLVVAEVPQEKIHLVKLGQKVMVVPTADSTREHPAKVSRIGVVARPRADFVERLLGGSDEMVVDVEIELEKIEGELKPGGSVKVKIDANHLEKVPSLPLAAVFHEGDEHHVIDTSGTRIPVTVGLNDGTHVAIEKGLEPGTSVRKRPDDA